MSHIATELHEVIYQPQAMDRPIEPTTDPGPIAHLVQPSLQQHATLSTPLYDGMIAEPRYNMYFSRNCSDRPESF